MSYPPQSAGGLMTTEFVSVPASWTALQVRLLVAREGSAKETVYAIYVHDEKQRLERVISLREVIMAASETPVNEIGDGRKPITVGPLVDREEVARLISNTICWQSRCWTMATISWASSRWTTSLMP